MNIMPQHYYTTSYISAILSADEAAVDGASSSNTQLESRLTVSSWVPSMHSCCPTVENVQPTFALNSSGRSDLSLLLLIECVHRTLCESRLMVSPWVSPLYSCCAWVENVQPTFVLNSSGRSDFGLLLLIECRTLRRSVEGSRGFSWFDFVGQKHGFAFHCKKIKTPWIPVSVVKITRKAISRPLERGSPLLVLRISRTHATAKMIARPTERRRARRLVRVPGCLRLTIIT